MSVQDSSTDKSADKTTDKQPVANRAAALKYDGKKAPTIVAKGTGSIAKKIIDIAEKNDVHIHNDPLLLEVLSNLELGDEIPEQLYLAVAKIIAFAYFLQGKHPEHTAKENKTNDEDKALLSASGQRNQLIAGDSNPEQ